ncbi:uncharacterized protein YlbG (UPF0298 family) [Scopulibacillus daqui]|uniref:UPF0298 protein JOD45_000433 n=1 Tax=Scopulibacillus daqui TaxID=1469162 RepID=A0ABS2PW52_9BACL|nr:DUF2129 domain-containing protein [Scopulibacillus daqui]MBM7644240.1 uncharacterized protein YlbG (UPF0298 family) [Scopulibacillus daqui]
MIVGRRRGLIVWLHHLKHVKLLRRFGYIHYVSKNMKYVVIYCDREKIENILSELKSLKYIKDVSVSCLHEIKTEYDKKKFRKEIEEMAYQQKTLSSHF